MPDIGRPQTAQDARYRSVTMAKRANPSAREQAPEDKSKLLNQLAGRTEESIVGKEAKNKMGKDEFLKLLTHQLKNQDPMNPMQQNKFAAELAQFSQLEQLSNLNNKMESMQKGRANQDKYYAASFVGKVVVTNGSSIEHEQGGKSDVIFNLEGDAKNVIIRLFDEKGSVIAEMERENLSKGSHQLTWDGKALDGYPAGGGKYTVDIKAWNKSFEPVVAATKVTGIVDSVNFSEDETILNVSGRKVFLRDVDSFQSPDNQHIKKQKVITGQAKTPTSTALGAVLSSPEHMKAVQEAKAPSKQNLAQKVKNYQVETKGIYD